MSNRVYVAVTNSPGLSGDIVVGAAVSGPYAAMVAADDGKSFDLAITLGSTFEVRSGCVYDHATTTFTRGNLERTSSGVGLPINFGAGARAAVVAAASSLPTRDETLGLRSLLGGGMGSSSGIVLHNARENLVRNSANSAADNAIGTPLKSIVLPGGILGPRGYYELEFRMTHSGSAINKNLGIFVGGVPMSLEWVVTTTGINTHGRLQTYNSSLATQDWSGSIVVNGTSGAPAFDGDAARTSAINTAVDQQLDIHVRWSAAAAAENITIRWLKLTAFYGA
jgi:hypothetical protein